MDLAVVDEAGLKVLEATSESAMVTSLEEIDRVIERALSTGVRAILLHAGNLPRSFFDLSSGAAEVILQKTRNYGLRLAVIYKPGTTPPSSDFDEAAAEDRRRGYFGLFEDRDAARAWLR